MTASERKLVHEYLRERGDVETYTEGDEPDRHLVVAPLALSAVHARPPAPQVSRFTVAA